MTVHIIKLCVGAENIADLAHWQRRVTAARLAAGLRAGPTCETRNTPKRAVDILAGGSLYWVIKGLVTVRQAIVGIETLDVGGTPMCTFELDTTLVRVEATPKRPFQGWRYLEAAEAPADLVRSEPVAAPTGADRSAPRPQAPPALRQKLLDAGVW